MRTGNVVALLLVAASTMAGLMGCQAGPEATDQSNDAFKESNTVSSSFEGTDENNSTFTMLVKETQGDSQGSKSDSAPRSVRVFINGTINDVYCGDTVKVRTLVHEYFTTFCGKGDPKSQCASQGQCPSNLTIAKESPFKSKSSVDTGGDANGNSTVTWKTGISFEIGWGGREASQCVIADETEAYKQLLNLQLDQFKNDCTPIKAAAPVTG